MALPLFNIGGLASGLDTDSIITGVLEVERIPINQLGVRRARYEAKDQAWQDVNTKLSAIRTALNAVDSLNDLNKFATANSSNESAVGVAVTGAATPGTISFTVNQLAANHQVVSDTSFASGDDLVGAGDFTITVDGTDYTVTATDTTTVNELAQQINALADLDVSASVISVDGTSSKLYLSADDSGAAAAFTTSGTIATLATTNEVQAGQDAELTLGSGAGALTLTRSSNTVTDLMPGVNITLQEVTTDPVTVTTGRDIDGAVEAIKLVVDEINAALTMLGDLTAYNADAETGGILVGDSTARGLIFDLRSALSSVVNTGSEDYPIASSIGISINREGTFDFNETKLRDALAADFDAVTDLLLETASAADSRVTFVSAGDGTVEGSYEVVITQAATKATALSDIYKKPNDDETFQIIVDGTSVDVSVSKNDDIATVVDAINSALAAAGQSAVTASIYTDFPHDYIQLDESTYGAASFEVVGDSFGLAGTYTGTDVAGTIGGEAATGSGQTLTADSGDPNGLSVLVTATADDVSGAGGSLSLGDVTYNSGVFGSLDRVIDAAEGAGGRIARARDMWQAQIDIIEDRMEVLEDRLERREALLIKQFAALESAMSALSAQGAWLTAQLTSLSGGSQ